MKFYKTVQIEERFKAFNVITTQTVEVEFEVVSGVVKRIHYKNENHFVDPVISELVIPSSFTTEKGKEVKVKGIYSKVFSIKSQKRIYGIKKLIISEGITDIYSQAFLCLSADTVVWPSSAKTVRERTFYDGHIKNITLSEGVTSIEASAFSGCGGLNVLSIPGSCETLGEWAFSDCRDLVTLKLGTNTRSIGEGAFSRCCCLKQVVWPAECFVIPPGCFRNCKNLTMFTANGPVEIERYAFFNVTNCTIDLSNCGYCLIRNGDLCDEHYCQEKNITLKLPYYAELEVSTEEE